MRYRDYSKVVVSDGDIQSIVDKEGEIYLTRDFIYFELTLANEEAKNVKIKEYAAKLKEAKTEEEFRAIVAEFVESEYCVNKEIKKKVNTQKIQNNVPEDDKNALDTWSFASTTVVGSTYLEEGNASQIVYMAVSEPVMDDAETRNMYTIVLEPYGYGSIDDCKAKADEIYNKWKADGAKLDDFKALVKQYSTDDVSVFAEGLYKNIKKDDMIEELDKWLFDENLEVGAHALIKTEFGCHIVYYAGKGEAAWKASVIEGLREDKVSSTVHNYVDRYPVTQVEGNMKYVKAN